MNKSDELQQLLEEHSSLCHWVASLRVMVADMVDRMHLASDRIERLRTEDGVSCPSVRREPFFTGCWTTETNTEGGSWTVHDTGVTEHKPEVSNEDKRLTVTMPPITHLPTTKGEQA